MLICPWKHSWFLMYYKFLYKLLFPNCFPGFFCFCCSFISLIEFKCHQGLTVDHFQGRRCQISDKNKDLKKWKYDYSLWKKKSELTVIWHLNDFFEARESSMVWWSWWDILPNLLSITENNYKVDWQSCKLNYSELRRLLSSRSRNTRITGQWDYRLWLISIKHH